MLEIAAFVSIVKNGVFQQSCFANAFITVSAVLYDGFDEITEYFLLKNTNTKLVEKNAFLEKKVINLENFILQKNYENSLKNDSDFEVLHAKVVEQTVDKVNNHLIINKGRKDGVMANMGVIGAEGVVGVVQKVTENYSVVVSALSTSLKISGKFKKNNYQCSVSWSGSSPGDGIIYNIPNHIPAQKGDIIITSGNSSIF
ncbi:MAG: rod shape-determining protein MreC, partial [Prevotellaceae bacterium]|nr:rod shape-determining protein MreC [Prevotellaceae bacterium]